MRKFLLALLLSLTPFLWRLRPSMGEKESYNAFFPKEEFLAKMASPIPLWMERQVKADLEGAIPLTAEALQKGFEVISSRLPEPIYLYHYRILGNQLYKYVPAGVPLSCRDNHYERALKTLLSHTSLPNLDFLLCPMDGIPEAFVSPTFYLLDDPKEQVPLLGQAKLSHCRHILLIPDQLSLSRDWYDTSREILQLSREIPWSQKIGKAFWRGGTSDRTAPEQEFTPRFFLCRVSKAHPEWVDAASTYCSDWMAIVEAEGLPKLETRATKRDHLLYKYQPVLDGAMCTYPGYQWRLLSNSLALKQESDQVQWFYSALKPYEHYLPVERNMGNLVEQVLWAEAHPKEVEGMIERAREFAKDHLLYEDCYRYLAFALTEYAKRQQIDFAKVKQEMKGDERWVNIHYRRRLAALQMLERLWGKVRSHVDKYLALSPKKADLEVDDRAFDL